MAGPAVSQRAGVDAAAALGAYLCVSILFFGLPVLSQFGSAEIGAGSDPQLFIWNLAWWPHAILHGENPFVTHAIWAPTASNLAWSTSVPGLALLLAPVTLTAGPVAAYNLAEILLPALAATTAFLLCRHLTRSFWPSLAGGYLFGFSSYMLGHELGHLHLTAVFLVPLAALVVLQFLEGAFGPRGLVARLTPLLVLQLTFSTEVFFTLTLALGAGVATAALTAPRCRPRLRAALLPLAGSYSACAVLAGVFVYYAFSDYQGVITPTGNNPADAVTFAFPTGLTEVAGRLAAHFDPLSRACPARTGSISGCRQSRSSRSSPCRAGAGPAPASSCCPAACVARDARSDPSRPRPRPLPAALGRRQAPAALRQRHPEAALALRLAPGRGDRRALGSLAHGLATNADRVDRSRRARDRPASRGRRLAPTA